MNALPLERPRFTPAKPLVKTPDAANEKRYWAVWAIPKQSDPVKREQASNPEPARVKHKQELFCDWS